MQSETTLTDPNLKKILIVDDEAVVLTTLRELLKLEGYNVTAVDNPVKALEIIQKENFSVILSDQEMAEMSGLSLLAKARELHPSTVRLLITGRLSLSEISEAARSGLIFRFIPKPWLHEELLVTLRNSVEYYRLLTENAALHARNVSLNLKLSQAQEAAEEQDSGGDGTTQGPDGQNIEAVPGGGGTGHGHGHSSFQAAELAVQAFTKMVYTFHPNLGNTALRAVALCQTMSEILELKADDTRNLLWAAALHDIAMVNIDRGIVRRWVRGPEKCTEEEMVLIKRHPEHAEQILKFNPIFNEAGEIIRSHHENWDGSGYPNGLKGEMIPWLSRLLAVVIYFCSKHSAGVQLMSEIESLKEIMFDPEAIQVVAKAVPLTKLPLGEREILLIELKPGMVLAREIYNANGFLLLPKGKELTEATINKVLSINRVTPIEPLVLVYC